MEKASKWIRNFLLGKKENKKIEYNRSGAELGAQNLPSLTPKVKRRWSFKRSTSRESGHRVTRSVDLIDVARLGVYVPIRSQARTSSVPVIIPGDGHAAATMIQSVFRSYLARKALRALRGLVKLQAIIRGYLVRKQTRATLKRYHSLISIQARARVHRIQMAKVSESEFNRQRSASNRKPHNEVTGINEHEFHLATKSKSGYFDFPNATIIERGFTAYYSGDISVSNHERQYEYYSSSTQNTPQHFSETKPVCLDTIDVPNFVPQYISNTESSKVKKTRSQSEPKQRSKLKSSGPIDTQTKNFGSGPMNADFESRDPWLRKFYREGRTVKDSERESTSSTTSKSNYNRSLLLYEPPLTMY